MMLFFAPLNSIEIFHPYLFNQIVSSRNEDHSSFAAGHLVHAGCAGADGCFLCHQNQQYPRHYRCPQKGADVNARDNQGVSLLMTACNSNNADAVQLLLAAGADVNLRDNAGNTALMGAALRGYDHIVRLLLDANAATDTVNEAGATALILAATFNRTAVVEQLLQKKANTHIKDKTGHTALYYAQAQSYAAITKLLRK